jgi:hypothetical protein
LARFHLVCAACLVFVVGLSGCGSDAPKIVPISGTVTRNNQPVPNLYLNFMPDTGRPSWGVTDSEGRFKLHYDRDYDGAVVGKHKVFVQFKPGTVEAELEMLAGKLKQPPELEAILEKYGSEQTTTKEVEITKADTNFVLELD